MKQEQFEEVINKQLEMIKDTLLVKSKEYATEDKLHNFRTAALMQQCTMEQALAGMLAKHTVSIYDMIQSGNRFDTEKWDEKINAHIVYLLLLRAIVQEKKMLSYVANVNKNTIMVDNPAYSLFMEHVVKPIRDTPIKNTANYVTIYKQFKELYPSEVDNIMDYRPADEPETIEVYFKDLSMKKYTYQAPSRINSQK